MPMHRHVWRYVLWGGRRYRRFSINSAFMCLTANRQLPVPLFCSRSYLMTVLHNPFADLHTLWWSVISSSAEPVSKISGLCNYSMKNGCFKRADGWPVTRIHTLATGFHVYMLRYEVKPSTFYMSTYSYFQVFRSQSSRSTWVALGITQVNCNIWSTAFNCSEPNLLVQ